jgi:hypothetical protein
MHLSGRINTQRSTFGGFFPLYAAIYLAFSRLKEKNSVELIINLHLSTKHRTKRLFKLGVRDLNAWANLQCILLGDPILGVFAVRRMRVKDVLGAKYLQIMLGKQIGY